MDKSTQSAFARRMRILREEADITKYRLSQLTGLTKQTLSRLELGQTQPTWDTVLKLARALGVEVGAFAVEEEAKPAKTKRERKTK